jgi:endonuclease-3 related protein
MVIYHSLLDFFGPRHWWPAETRFEIIVGAILTQSVSWRNVVQAINNLKTLSLLDPFKIVQAPAEVLEQAVRPTRYYRQKAERLRNFCLFLIENYQGDLSRAFQQDLWEMRERLLALKGIGQETADSILLYAGEMPIFVVDAYTRRIFSRLGIFPADAGYEEMQRFFMAHLPPDTALYNEYHALIDGLGNNFCSNNRPACGECPLRDMCAGGTIEESRSDLSL